MRWCDQGRPSRLRQGLASACLLLAVCLAHYPGTVTASPQVGPGDWVEVKKITAPDGAPEDQFGISLAAQGDTLIVGVPLDDDDGTNSGSVYVFERNLAGFAEWDLLQKITRNEAQTTGDHFGYSVALDGDTLVVGALEDSPQPYRRSGSVYVFVRDPGQHHPWVQKCKRYPADGVNGDFFGTSVAVSGERILIGASHMGDHGAAFVYGENVGGQDAWGLEASLEALQGEVDGVRGLGTGVALSGVTAVVGAPTSIVLSWQRTGAAFVYYGGASGDPGAWAEGATLSPSDSQSADDFGFRVATSRGTIVIGSPSNDAGANASGAAYVYERPFAGSVDWMETTKLAAFDPSTYTLFGAAVAIDGDRIVVGALRDYLWGAVYVFDRYSGGPDAWGCTAKLRASDGAVGDELGLAVVIDGHRLFAAAPRDDDLGDESGSVYCFELPPPIFIDGFESGDAAAWSAAVP